jgi:hypothetical protein
MDAAPQHQSDTVKALFAAKAAFAEPQSIYSCLDYEQAHRELADALDVAWSSRRNLF